MKVILFLCLFAVTSCWGTRNYEDQYLYDKVGFKANRRPVTSNRESNKIHSIAPNRNYYDGYNRAPIYPGAVRGGSRFYANPYAIPPAQIPQGQEYQGGYSGYKVYDADRFYVPPNSYRYIEKPDEPNNTGFEEDSCSFGC